MHTQKHTVETKRIMSFKHKKPILQYTKWGELVKIWYSALDASKELGCSPVAINHCLKRRQKTCKGYVWHYQKDIIEDNNVEIEIEDYEKDLIELEPEETWLENVKKNYYKENAIERFNRLLG